MEFLFNFIGNESSFQEELNPIEQHQSNWWKKQINISCDKLDKITIEKVLVNINTMHAMVSHNCNKIRDYISYYLEQWSEQSERTRLGDLHELTQRIILEKAGWNVSDAPSGSDTDFVVWHPDRPSSVYICNVKSTHVFAPKSDNLKENMVKFRHSDFLVNGIPIKDLDVEVVIGSTTTEKLSQMTINQTRVHYVFGCHFVAFFGIKECDLDYSIAKAFPPAMRHCFHKQRQAKLEDTRERLYHQLMVRDHGMYRGKLIVSDDGELDIDALRKALLQTKPGKCLHVVMEQDDLFEYHK